MEYRGLEVEWRGHATVTVSDNGFTVAVDPYGDFAPESADLVLITHAHSGHFDRETLEELCGDGTCVVAPESFEEDEVPCRDVELVGPESALDVYGVTVETVPMYNEYHERKAGFGYRFTMAGTSIYVAGDAGYFDEAKDLEGRTDLAFLPVEGVYTMDEDEAVRLATRIKPEIVVPYHYGEPFFGDEDVDLKGFASEIEDRSMSCRILD